MLDVLRGSLRAAALVAVATAIALAGCGSNDDGTTAASGGSATAVNDGTGPAGDAGRPASGEPAALPAATGSDARQIRVLLDYLQERYIAGDGPGYCAGLTADGRKLVAEISKSYRLGDTCEKFVVKTAQMGRETNTKQKPSKIVSVKVKGNRAVAQVSDAGRPPAPLAFAKEDGRWKLPDPGFGSPSNESEVVPQGTE